MLNTLSAWLGWLQEQPKVLMFCTLRLHRNLIIYELVSISSRLYWSELGFSPSFLSCTIVVWFSAKKKPGYLKPTSELPLFNIHLFNLQRHVFSWNCIFFLSLTQILSCEQSWQKQNSAPPVMTSPDVHPAPSQGLCLQLPTNMCRRWRTRNSLYPQPELEIWEQCPICMFNLHCNSIIHSHAHDNHNRHIDKHKHEIFLPSLFFFLPNLSSPSVFPFYLEKNIPTCYHEAFGFVCFSTEKKRIFQAKLLASCTTPRANQGMVYSSVPFLSLEQMPCVWKHLPVLNPVNPITIFKKSYQECHIPCI